MRRSWKLLLALVLAPSPSLSQVDVALVSRDDGARMASLAALERSRAALIEAHEAVEAALTDVDGAIRALRGEPGAPALAAAPEGIAAADRAGLTVVMLRLGAGLAQSIGSWWPTLEEMRNAACRLEAAQVLADSADESALLPAVAREEAGGPSGGTGSDGEEDLPLPGPDAPQPATLPSPVLAPGEDEAATFAGDRE